MNKKCNSIHIYILHQVSPCIINQLIVEINLVDLLFP
uniref:Uncharacterized protein n=1 Tax=Tetranychus urticae TaxID=32264 RepID=T1K0C7_TETUR